MAGSSAGATGEDEGEVFVMDGIVDEGTSESGGGMDINLIFFLFTFSKKNDPTSKSMTPRRGNTILCSSSQQLPRLCLGHLKGFLS